MKMLCTGLPQTNAKLLSKSAHNASKYASSGKPPSALCKGITAALAAGARHSWELKSQ
jgi:hypothetical protein